MARRDSGASSDDGPLTARITNEAFLCPIGCTTMRDPVFLADGHSYERANIDAWIERRHAAGLAVTSPATGAVMPEPLSLSPNHALRAAIEEWLVQRHGYLPPAPPSPVRRLKLAEQPAASSQWRVLPDRSALLRLAVWGWAALAVWAALSLLLYHEPAIQGLLLR